LKDVSAELTRTVGIISQSQSQAEWGAFPLTLALRPRFWVWSARQTR